MGSCMNKQDVKQQRQQEKIATTTEPKPTQNSVVNIAVSFDRDPTNADSPVRASQNSPSTFLPSHIPQNSIVNPSPNPKISYTNSYYKVENQQPGQEATNQAGLKTTLERQAEILRLSDPVEAPRMQSHIIQEPKKSLEYFEQKSKQSILIRQFAPRT